MAKFLGVDGGQSGTCVLVGDETGAVVGVGWSGSCREEGSFRAALDAAGASGVEFESACLGLSGGTDEAAARAMVPAARYIFTHDADVALCGALAGKPGVIVIAGTGSMAFGRNAEGNTARAGGWGYVFGDEGGGFDLARQALRAALRHEEAWGPKTALRGLLLEATGASDAHELMHRFYARGISKAKMAALAPLVDRAAVGGDGIAQDILKSAAQTLAMFAGAVRAQLFPRGESVAVSYGGGVFRSPVVLARCRMLVELEDGNRVTEPVYGPAAGALLEAYRAAGVTCMLKNVPREKV